ncbi:MAG: MarR family transcriptional regulator [Pseudomonadota bacterium]
MNSSRNDPFSFEVQHRYRDNFARHFLGVTLYLQAEIMNALTVKHGHSQLRLNFEPYISVAGDRGARLSDIAHILGISRQAAMQTANRIESIGYLRRETDPTDGRAKLLVPTPRGKALMVEGTREALHVQSRFDAIVGQPAIRQALSALLMLHRELNLLFPTEDASQLHLAALMPRMADYISERLQTLTMAKGHPQLKRSFGQVLMYIGPEGGQIQQMANAQDLSKQAISVIASELKDCGYLQRRPDPEDARQLVLQFTELGKQLISDSVESVDELMAEFTAVIGAEAMDELIQVSARIYRTLRLDEEVFGYTESNDINVIARQLNRQLGEAGAKQLAHLLLSGDPYI